MYIFVEDYLLGKAVMAINRYLEISDDQYNIFVKNGKDAINVNINNYREMSRFSKVIALRDFDNDAKCPLELKNSLGFQGNDNYKLLFSIREVESWLLADRESFANFFSVSKDKITANPESIADPKVLISQLAKASRRRAIREAFTPIGRYNKIGPLHNITLSRFISENWNVNLAAQRSKSLRYAIDSIILLNS